jgi:ligand-binding sensor domain-containing protein
VYHIYKDPSGGMWAGTWSGGVNYLPATGEKFTLYEQTPGNPASLNNNSIISISGDASGNLWIGTDGGGINFLIERKRFFHLSLTTLSIPRA